MIWSRKACCTRSKAVCFYSFKDCAAVLGRPVCQQRKPRCCTSCAVNSFNFRFHITCSWFNLTLCDNHLPLSLARLLCSALFFFLGWSLRSNMLQLYSNPGDYAWGQSGLDSVITEVSYTRASVYEALWQHYYLQHSFPLFLSLL